MRYSGRSISQAVSRAWRAWCVVLATILTSAAHAAPDRPNIILILADDLGWSDVGCYGNRFHETPHIDRLAADGLRFTDFYAAGPVCSPTRASILCGQHPARTGITDFIPGYRRPYARLDTPPTLHHLRPEAATVAGLLQTAGYATGYFGKWHLGEPDDLPTAHGFDTAVVTTGGHFAPPLITLPAKELPKGTYQAERITDEAVEFMHENRDRPFFVMVSYAVPHVPLQARDELIRKYAQKPPPAGAVGHPVYAAMIEHLDRGVGRIVDELEALGVKNQTAVFFTSDNGALSWIFDKNQKPIITSNAPLRDQKGSLYEGGIRVPLIVRWPGRVPPGTTCTEPAVSCDLLPTLAEMAGLKTAPTQIIDGLSLSLVLKDPRAKLDREAIYFHYPHYHTADPAGAIRAGRWKLIESFERGTIELYDLERDAGETRDLARQEPKIAGELHQKLNAWRSDIGAKMPVKNSHYDPARADELWSDSGKGPLDAGAIERQIREQLHSIRGRVE